MSETPITPNYVTPGWYLDPSNPLLRRWWDGQGWTDQVFTGDYLQSSIDVQRPAQHARVSYAYGLSGWTHFAWFLVTCATFGVGGIGWFIHWSARRMTPRRTGVVK